MTTTIDPVINPTTVCDYTTVWYERRMKLASGNAIVTVLEVLAEIGRMPARDGRWTALTNARSGEEFRTAMYACLCDVHEWIQDDAAGDSPKRRVA